MNKADLSRELVEMARELMASDKSVRESSIRQSPWKLRNGIADDLQDVVDKIRNFYIREESYNFPSEDGGEHKEQVDADLDKIREVVDKFIREINRIKSL